MQRDVAGRANEMEVATRLQARQRGIDQRTSQLSRAKTQMQRFILTAAVSESLMPSVRKYNFDSATRSQSVHLEIYHK